MARLRTWGIAIAVAGAAAFARPAFAAAGQAADGPDYLRLMDTSAPKYNTPECQAARASALEFERKQPGHLLLAFVPIVGLAVASADQEEARKLNHDLTEGCGDEAFIPFFEVDARKGDEDAQAMLGQTYWRLQNWEKALYWYRLAAEQEHPGALVNLGVMYRKGQGVPKDDAEAERLWRAAAGEGNNSGRTNLGALYVEQQRYDEARRLLRDAAERGHASAQFHYGELYEKGFGVHQSDEKAYGWYVVAFNNGYAEAASRRDAIRARLDQGVIARVHRGALACEAKRYRRCQF